MRCLALVQHCTLQEQCSQLLISTVSFVLADWRLVILERKVRVSECLGFSHAEEMCKAVVVGYFAVGLLFQQVPGQPGECYRRVTINCPSQRFEQ
jgi:hypothetical protein